MSSSVAEAAAKERLHSSGEDYLKAIFILEAQHGSVRSVEVAEYMNVSKASVNHAVIRVIGVADGLKLHTGADEPFQLGKAFERDRLSLLF